MLISLSNAYKAVESVRAGKTLEFISYNREEAVRLNELCKSHK